MLLTGAVCGGVTGLFSFSSCWRVSGICLGDLRLISSTPGDSWADEVVAGGFDMSPTDRSCCGSAGGDFSPTSFLFPL
ncbi:hypothetical protein BDP67DRAFT_515128 [Colletotrichum lupini]|nr:hypothetical protein BDP67DRAFT_515128 [Colletotrichum lupini]